MPPMFIQDYRQRAQECDHRAETAASPRIRKIMLYTASQWRAVADREEARVTRAKQQRIRPQPVSAR
jgi:hypothetical protein